MNPRPPLRPLPSRLACCLAILLTGCSRENPTPLNDAVEIDFYEAAGVSQQELSNFLDGVFARDMVDDYPMYVSLQNDAGDYLVDQPVIVRWASGEHRLMVGQSGVIQFLITKSKLPQLKILAPPGFAHLTQRTVPLGPAYRAEETLVTSHLPYTVHFDGHRTRDLLRGLSRLRSSGDVLDYEAFQSQLRRKHFAWEPPAGEGAALEPGEIYASRRASVVVIGHLFAEGNHTHAAGVVLDPQGIVATAYHVVDKPASVVARGVMTHDGRVHAIREILAANRSDDVVLLRIDASDLIAAPLSSGDREGTPVTVIAHPGTNFYSLTQGHISRYWAATYRGRLTVNMGITAEFADGASGGPVFSPAGAVTGLVSSTDALGNQMVRRAAVPVQAIWDLLRPPAEPVDMPDVSDAPERHQRQ